MLGLGLGFVKMLFGGAMDKFGALVEDEQDPSPPSGSDPVSLSRGIITIGPGQDTAIKVALYNPTNAAWSDVKPIITCSNTATDEDFEDFSYTANKKTIQAGKYETYGILLDIPSVGETTELCEIAFNENYGAAGNTDGTPITGYSEDFTIRVQHK